MKLKLIENFGFDYNGKHYMIKVFQAGLGYIIRPYFSNREASFFSYSVKVNNMEKWQHLYGNKSPVARLLEIVEQDIRDGYGLKT